MLLPITKNGSIISQLPVPDGMSRTRELMGAREIRADIELPSTLLSPIGSHITVKGEQYTINTPPLSIAKFSRYRYQYSVVFESTLYKLYDKKLKADGNKVFQDYRTPQGFAQLIADNINEIDSGWSVGVCEDLPEKIIDFSGHSCRTALDYIAEAFQIEWRVVGKVISFVKKVGNLTTLEFSYGKGNGLYSLSCKYQNDKNVVTRAFGYGSSRNLPAGYRDGANQLMFDGGYLDKNVFLPDSITPLYGVKEGDYENQDIYPEINEAITAVSAYDPDANTFTVTASGLDFDLNDYFGPLDPKLSFKSGELQGQEFTIRKYDHATRVITLDVFTDEQGNRLPNGTFQAAIGDTFTLFDMYLPDEIIQDAEDRLQAATQAWLDENCVPRLVYSLELDPLYLRDNAITLNEGDEVRLIDASLGVDELLRITKITEPVQFPDIIPENTKITCEIANFIPYTQVERVISDTLDNKTEIRIVDRTNAMRARRNAMDFKLLSSRLFDPDGNLAKGAETVFAAMIVAGFDSQNFELRETIINTNIANDPNHFTITAGFLSHNIYEIPELGYEWEMDGGEWVDLDPVKYYYVYAKCSKTALAGTWEISETPVSVNDIPGFWAFNLGQLMEVNTEGYRRVQFTKGTTNIVGNTIDTGTINAELVNVININATNIVAGTLNAAIVDVINLDADNITTGTLAASRIDAGNLFVGNSTDGWIINKDTIRSKAETSPGVPRTQLLTNGALYANNASISGDIYAYSGAIGGIQLNSSSIYSNNGLFSLTSLGKLIAQDAEITGHIVATSGEISASLLVGSLSANIIDTGTLDAALVSVVNLDADNITSGKVATARLDVDDLLANYINTAYIEGLTLNFEQGTIGGNTISSTGITGAKFDITNGVITAEDAIFTNIEVDGLTAVNALVKGTIVSGDDAGQRVVLNGSGGSLEFYSPSNVLGAGIKFDAIENSTIYTGATKMTSNFGFDTDYGLRVFDPISGGNSGVTKNGIYTNGTVRVYDSIFDTDRYGTTLTLQYKDHSGVNQTLRVVNGIVCPLTI